MARAAQKAAIHQLTTMLSTSENTLFSGHNHLLTSGVDDLSLAGTRVIIKVKGHQHWKGHQQVVMTSE